jgi:hypothetical protein
LELVANTIGPALEEQRKESERIIKSRKGIMDRRAYGKILACLHPDRTDHFITDSKLRQTYRQAFDLFRDLEKRLLDERESPSKFVDPFPKTAAGWEELKRRAAEDRKTKREGNPTV